MIRFKDWLIEEQKKKPVYHLVQTSFGTHSIPLVQTQFGKHSVPAKPLKLKEAKWQSMKGQLDHDELKKHYDNYTDTDKHAITRYTGSSFPMNNFLHKQAHGEIKPDVVHPEAKQMDDVVNRHNTHKKMAVYSGLAHSPEGKDHLRHPAFLSTSTDQDEANDFAHPDKESKLEHPDAKGRSPGHMLKLEVPKDHPAAYIAHHSNHTHEREMILGRNTEMKKTKEPEYDKGRNV